MLAEVVSVPEPTTLLSTTTTTAAPATTTTLLPQVAPPDLTDFDFPEIVPGVPVWVPIVAQAIPWIVAGATDRTTSNRTRFLLNICVSMIVGIAAAIQQGAGWSEAIAAAAASVVSAQVGYDMAKGYSNGAIKRYSNRGPMRRPETDNRGQQQRPMTTAETMRTVTGQHRRVATPKTQVVPSVRPAQQRPDVQHRPVEQPPPGQWVTDGNEQRWAREPVEEPPYDPPPSLTATQGFSFDDGALRPIVRDRFDGNADSARSSDQPPQEEGRRYL